MKKFFMILVAFVATTLSLRAQNPILNDSITGVCGQTVTITATAEPGYEFDSWQDGNTQNPRQIVVSSDSTIWTYVASFRPTNKTIVATVNNEDWGTVTGAGTGLVGSKMTLTATPTGGCYRFKQWSDGNTNATRVVTVSANDAENTYQAIFEEVEFKVHVKANQHGSVSISVQ